jgi:GT2 family glycosyltransferase
MEKVIAVVVSYNRQELLSECITALRNQSRPLDAILVINNGSTDNTEQWLSEQEDITFITQANTGSGGGFNTGINRAYRAGYSWIWCMDDDGYPKEDALENLLKHETAERSLMNCAVINKEDKRSFVWKTGAYKTIDEVKEARIENIGHPFNGTLLHRSIVEKVGIPTAAFFMWGDETEYYYRIVKKNKIPVFTVSSSIHYHPAATFNYKRDWEFKSSWKMYYYVRNRYHIQKAKFNNKALAFINYMVFIAAFAGIIILFQKTNKIQKLYSIVGPATDAFTNNFAATPALILAKLNKQEVSAPQHTVIAPVRYLWSMIFNTSHSHKPVHNSTAA